MKQSRYNTILDSVLRLTNNTVFEIGTDFTFIEVYLGAPGDLLLEKDAFIGRTIMEVVPEGHWKMVQPFFENAKTTGERIHFSYPSFIPGEERWFTATLQFISSGCEYPFYLLCVMDCTEQKKVEASIRFQAAFEEQMIYATSTLLQTTQENFDESVNAVLARIGSFANADRAYIFRFNEHQQTMDNSHEWCSEGINPEIDNLKGLPVDIFPEWMRKLRNNEEVYIPDVQLLPAAWIAEKSILEPQGILSLLVLPVTAAGKLYGFIGFDAVKNKIAWEKAQRQLLQLLADNLGSVILRHQQAQHLQEVTADAQLLADKATRASRYKSDFLANMSHEMRTPLHGVLGFTDILMNTNPQPQQLQYLGHLKESAESMLRVINQILDFSKIESGKMGLELVKSDLPALIRRCCNKIRVTAAAKGLAFIYHPDPCIPEKCILDDMKLEQVLNNLLGNAIKFTEKGRVELRVEVQSEPDSDNKQTLFFSISDTGIGIPHEQQLIIFQAFSQADTSISRKYGGTGLGLSISKKFLDLMGSDLLLRSTKDKGSVFSFELEVQRV